MKMIVEISVAPQKEHEVIQAIKTISTIPTVMLERFVLDVKEFAGDQQYKGIDSFVQAVRQAAAQSLTVLAALGIPTQSSVYEKWERLARATVEELFDDATVNRLKSENRLETTIDSLLGELDAVADMAREARRRSEDITTVRDAIVELLQHRKK